MKMGRSIRHGFKERSRRRRRWRRKNFYNKSQHDARNKRRENSGNVASCRQSNSLYYREVTDFSRPHVNSLRLRRDLSAAGNTSSRSFPRIDREPLTVKQRLHLTQFTLLRSLVLLLLLLLPSIYICNETSSRLRKMLTYELSEFFF